MAGRKRPVVIRPEDFADAESQRVLNDAAGEVAYALGAQAADAYLNQILKRQADKEGRLVNESE